MNCLVVFKNEVRHFIPNSNLEKIAQMLNIRISDIFGVDDKFILNNNKIEQVGFQSIDKGLSAREILLCETQIKENKETISYLQEQAKLFGKLN